MGRFAQVKGEAVTPMSRRRRELGLKQSSGFFVPGVEQNVTPGWSRANSRAD